MNHIVNLKNSFLILFVFAVVLTPLTPVFASGSGGFNSQNAVAAYEQGKNIFHKKIICESCPLPNLVVDQQVAQDLIPKLRRKGELGKHLRWGERSAVKLYLKERYKL